MVVQWDLSTAAAALRNGHTTAEALLELHLQKITLHERHLNCFVTMDEVGARDQAKASQSRHLAGTPLSKIDGIPIALKDNIDVAGVPTSNGTVKFSQAPHDSAVANQLRAAGAVLVGKLNMDECALGGTTDNPHHGVTHNPWRHGYTPGGSSGGSGAAVAAGMVVAALGTDTLGSVRLPAAYCGIVGVKPTQGLINMAGISPLSPSLDQVGPLCRCVEDCATMLSIMVGEEMHEGVQPMDKALQFGVLTPIEDNNCETDVLAGFEKTRSDLAKINGDTIQVTLPEIDFPTLRKASLLFIEAEAWIALSGQVVARPDAYSETFKNMLAYGRDVDPRKKTVAKKMLKTLGDQIRCLFDKIDILVLPAAPQLAFAFADPIPSNQIDFTALASLSGCPSIVLPTGLSSSGLPLSAQLMAAPYKDHQLLSVAAELECRWGRLDPPV